ncbi:hypothetical protein AVEN_140914-1 [Araneus ventricosus]|uniref:Uncharacterized protein n=1 Tax=Araneus ventricosus TaxID=182803 RepID=A0A4Y2JM82_ARAVE|nr:hypothetical protein AVEN_140914-1 [Araneus ventricosus]
MILKIFKSWLEASDTKISVGHIFKRNAWKHPDSGSEPWARQLKKERLGSGIGTPQITSLKGALLGKHPGFSSEPWETPLGTWKHPLEPLEAPLCGSLEVWNPPVDSARHLWATSKEKTKPQCISQSTSSESYYAVNTCSTIVSSYCVPSASLSWSPVKSTPQWPFHFTTFRGEWL